MPVKKIVPFPAARSVFAPAFGAAALLGLLMSLTLPAAAQVTRLRVDLYNGYSDLRMGSGQGSQRQSLYHQMYGIGLQGYVYDPRLLMFDVRSGLQDQSLRSASDRASTSSHSRTLDHYAVTLSLFPSNSYPMTFFAKSGRRANSQESSSEGGEPVFRENGDLLTSVGATVSLPKNGYWPRTSVSISRDTRVGDGVSLPYDQSSERFLMNMSNTVRDNSASYSLRVSRESNAYELSSAVSEAGRTMDLSYLQRQKTHVNFGGSLLLPHGKPLGVDMRYAQLDSWIQADAGAQAEMPEIVGTQHRTRMRVGNNRSRNFDSRFYSVAHHASLLTTPAVQVSMNNDYYGDRSRSPAVSQTYVRAGSEVEVRFLPSGIDIGRLDTRTSVRYGVEGYSTLGRVQTFVAGVNTDFQSIRTGPFIFGVSNDVNYADRGLYGRLLSNTFRSSVGSDAIRQSTIEMSVSHRYQRSYISILPALSEAGVRLRFAGLIAGGLAADISHERRFTSYVLYDVSDISSMKLIQRRVIRDLTLEVSLRRYISRLGVANRMHASVAAEYVLRAFLLRGAYEFERIVRFNRSGFRFEVQRNFTFDF